MNDEQFEKYLKQLRFSKPAPELRQHILNKADEHWFSVKKREENSHVKVNSSALFRIFSHRFERVITAVIAVAIFIASFGFYNNGFRQQRDNIVRFSSPCLLGDRIGERVESMTFSSERWYNKSEERKMIMESIKKRFSPPEIMEKR